MPSPARIEKIIVDPARGLDKSVVVSFVDAAYRHELLTRFTSSATGLFAGSLLLIPDRQ